MRQPRPKIEEKEGHVVLIVEDTEVFDFLEDILSEQHGLEYSYLESEKVNGVETYKLHFSKNISPTRIQTAVDSIDQNELQRIWDLNN